MDAERDTDGTTDAHEGNHTPADGAGTEGECFASMSFQQAHQYFSAVWADGFPRSRHHAVSDVR